MSDVLSLFLRNVPSYIRKGEGDKINEIGVPKIKIKLLCNWCSSSELSSLWNKMSKGNYTWNNIVLVLNDDEPDYWVVINKIRDGEGKNIDKKRTILFRMEPNMKYDSNWKEWSNPSDNYFLRIFRHEREEKIYGDFNNCEWHLSLNYNQLLASTFSSTKLYNTELSTVLSCKYSNIGHVKRVDFVKFLESKGMIIHVYGDNKWKYKNFKGSLPYHKKDDALIPYKYTFNCENQFVSNYFTEKLIDGILSECLVFYAGCPNVRQYIDKRAFIQLELSNFEHDYALIQRVISENWYEKHLPFIKNMKLKILNELQFFPRLERFFNQK